MTVGFIDDGYTVAGYVKEAPGLHAAVSFTYRAATAGDRAAVYGCVGRPKASSRSPPAGKKKTAAPRGRPKTRSRSPGKTKRPTPITCNAKRPANSRTIQS
jgi:hypothetical protein